jgi:hypothetical protein
MKRPLIFVLPLLISLHSLCMADSAYVEIDSLVTQVPPNKGASLLKLDTIDEIKGAELAPSKDKLLIKTSGVYFISATGQIGAVFRGAEGYMDLWLVKNGKDVPDSSVRRALSKSNPMSIITTTFLLELSAGDTLAAAFSASEPSLGFLFLKPDVEPAITSFTLSMFKINSD